MIDITVVDLVKFAQKVYELSVPRGMGILHFTPTPLSDEEAAKLLEDGPIALRMDYVHGRGCKMTVRRDDGNRLSIADSWYDHTDYDLQTLLAAFSIHPIQVGPHGAACECNDCVKTRR